MTDMLCGELVRLTVESPEVMAKNFVRWNQDTGWARFLDTDPPRLLSENKWKELMEKDLAGGTGGVLFSIRTLDKDLLIGFVALFDLRRQHGDTLVAIALGERKYWGNGFGTDAMRVMLRYAFNEQNMRKVWLIVFEYNPRAIRSYEKAGFVHEGRVRGAMLRDGRRWDYLYMGILRDEWLAKGILTE